MLQTLSKNRNYVFFSIFLIVLVSIFTAFIIGTQKNQVYAQEHNIYEIGLQALTEGNSTEAKRYFGELLNNHEDSFLIQWYYGLAIASEQDFDSAIKHFEQAQLLRPFLLREPIFVVQFGEILYFNGDLEKAKVYFERALSLEETPEDLIPHLNSMLGSISN